MKGILIYNKFLLIIYFSFYFDKFFTEYILFKVYNIYSVFFPIYIYKNIFDSKMKILIVENLI